MEAWQGSLPTLLAATGANVMQGDYYGPDGPGELGGFPAIGEIDASHSRFATPASRAEDLSEPTTTAA